MNITQFVQGVIILIIPFTLFPASCPEKSIEQHAAQLYFEKPYLQHFLSEREYEKPTTTTLKKRFRKMSKFLSSYGLNLGMFTYCSYKIYEKHGEIYGTENMPLNKGGLKETILTYIPSNIINAPKHTSFFLDSVEIIVKAFVLKTVIKLLIFLGSKL